MERWNFKVYKYRVVADMIIMIQNYTEKYVLNVLDPLFQCDFEC